jgi:hypothetical protein
MRGRRDALQEVIFQVHIEYLRCKETWGVNRLKAILHARNLRVRRSVNCHCYIYDDNNIERPWFIRRSVGVDKGRRASLLNV